MLKTRIVTALFLIALVGYFLYIASVDVSNLFIITVSFIAAWEWTRLAKLQGNVKKVLYSFLVMFSSWLAIYWMSIEILLVLTLLVAVIMLVFVVRYQITKGDCLYYSTSLTLGLGIIALIVFFQSLVNFREHFLPNVLLLSLAVVWVLDAGAYLFGSRFGRVKLAIYISPGKTWEGVYGGTIVAFILSWLGLILLSPNLNIPYLVMALLMAFIATYSVLGDLFESLLKRQAGIKDSGTKLPGHGGLLDRIDSMIIATPMFYFLWLWTLD